MRKRFALFLLLLAFAACNPSFVTEEQLYDYVLNPENGVIKKQEMRSTVMEMYYKPVDFILSQQLNGVVNEAERKATHKQFDSLDYFVLRISRNDKQIEAAYAFDNASHLKVVNYLAYNIASDLFLISGNDTIPAIDAIYAPTYGSSKTTDIITVFKSYGNRNENDLKVYFDDAVLGTGLNEFIFKNDDIKRIPHLKLN